MEHAGLSGGICSYKEIESPEFKTGLLADRTESAEGPRSEGVRENGNRLRREDYLGTGKSAKQNVSIYRGGLSWVARAA